MSKEDENVDFEKEGKLSEDEIMELIGELPPPRIEDPLPVIENGELSEDEIEEIINLSVDQTEHTSTKDSTDADEMDDFAALLAEMEGDIVKTPEATGAAEVLASEKDDPAQSEDDLSALLEGFEAADLTDENTEAAEIMDLNAYGEEEDADFDDLLTDFPDVNDEEIAHIMEEFDLDMEAFNDEGFDFYEELNIADNLDIAKEFEVDANFTSGKELEFVNDVTVYDNVDRADPLEDAIKKAEKEAEESTKAGYNYTAVLEGVPEEEPEKKGVSLSTVTSAISSKFNMNLNNVLIGALVVLVFVSIGAGFFIVSAIEKSVQPDNPVFISADAVEQPKYTLNNASYIYLDTVQNGGTGDELILNKILVDKAGTRFYFNQKLDWSKYELMLIDDNDKEYEYDISALEKGNISDMVRFEKLDPGIRGIQLDVVDKKTGLEESFLYRFDPYLTVPPMAYLKYDKVLYSNDSGSLTITNGEFNASESSLTFEIKTLDSVGLDFDTPAIVEGSRRITAIDDNNEMYHIREQDTIISKINFGPVSNLTSQVSIELRDVFTTYEFSENISLKSIMNLKDENQMKLAAGDNTVTLERFGRMGDFYILVLNGVNGSGEHVETLLDVDLTLTKADGDTITIAPMKINSAYYGTDIVFDVSEIGGSFTEYELNLNKIRIKTDDIIGTIDVGGLPRESDGKVSYAIDSGAKYLLKRGYSKVQNELYYNIEDRIYLKYKGVQADGAIEEVFIVGIQDGIEWKFKNWSVK